MNELEIQYPETDLHILEMAILQNIFLDCAKDFIKDENNEDYFKAHFCTHHRLPQPDPLAAFCLVFWAGKVRKAYKACFVCLL